MKLSFDVLLPAIPNGWSQIPSGIEGGRKGIARPSQARRPVDLGRVHASCPLILLVSRVGPSLQTPAVDCREGAPPLLSLWPSGPPAMAFALRGLYRSQCVSSAVGICAGCQDASGSNPWCWLSALKPHMIWDQVLGRTVSPWLHPPDPPKRGGRNLVGGLS